MMADVEDVSAALANIVASIIYPAGVPGIPANGAPTQVMTGWPKADALDAFLQIGGIAGATGGVIISVYPQPGMSSRVTRHVQDWFTAQVPTITATVAMVSGAATFGGVVESALTIGLVVPGRTVLAQGVVGDTAAGLAGKAAAALVAAGFAATASGAVLSCAALKSVLLGGQGQVIREVEREKQTFQITVWAPTQPLRRATAAAIESNLFLLDRIPLPDGTVGDLLFERNLLSDATQKQGEYRRDIFASVEYQVTVTAPAWSVVAIPLTAPN